jgi:hypothetical protein
VTTTVVAGVSMLVTGHPCLVGVRTGVAGAFADRDGGGRGGHRHGRDSATGGHSQKVHGAVRVFDG